jgi:hypothetical protein
MNVKEFFKPTKLTMLLFVIFVIVMYAVLFMTGARIFQCMIQPVVPNPPPATVSTCGLGLLVGVRQSTTALGIIEMIVMFFVIPHLIACGINAYVHKR